MNALHLIKSSRKVKALLAGVIILTIGIVSALSLTFNADAEHPYTIRYQTLESGDGTLIQAIVYTPVETSGNHPGVVVGHGFCLNKQYMQPLSIELVKRGFVVVNIDFRGHGSSEGYLSTGERGSGLVMDMMAGVEYLEGLGFVNRIGLVGHSMGGGTALITALQNPTKINATVAIGSLSTSSSVTNVSNLLVAFGLYEQGISSEEGLDFLRVYTGHEDVQIGTQYGNFSDGNATKVIISPYSEHLAEVLDYVIIYETVQWFEFAFNGAQATDIQLTIHYLLVSLIVSLIGCLLVLFTFISYLGSFIFKSGQIYPRALDEDEKFPFIPILGYLFAALLAVVLLSPLSELFVDVVPITMFNSVFAGQAVGLAIMIVAVSFLLSYKGGKFQVRTIAARIKEMSSTSPFLSLLYGVVTGLISISVFTSIAQWSIVASMPTTREIGVIISLVILLFPFLFIREFYLRGYVQERLNPSSRIREYFTIVGIAVMIDLLVFLPIMMIGWQSESLSFVALALTAVALFSSFRQVLVSWVYMNSGRNIVGSTIFYCILFAWMIVNFYPFGQPMMLL